MSQDGPQTHDDTGARSTTRSKPSVLEEKKETKKEMDDEEEGEELQPSTPKAHDEENQAPRNTAARNPRVRWWMEFAAGGTGGLLAAGVLKWVWDIPATRCR
jgi:hypothetical protein